MSLTDAGVVALALLLIGGTLGTLWNLRLRRRGGPTSPYISSSVALAWVGVVVLIVLLGIPALGR